jgi:hypothetical protein
MTPFQRRVFILIDEWLGILLCVYLWRTHDSAFWTVFIMWTSVVYGCSYPLHLWKEYQENRKKIFNLNFAYGKLGNPALPKTENKD